MAADQGAFQTLFSDSDSDSEINTTYRAAEWSTSSSDEDEEALASMELLLSRDSRNCVRGYVEDTVPNYNEKEFLTHFRISRLLMQDLSARFEASDIYQALKTHENSRVKITPSEHLLIFLWFAGHQTASFRMVADRFDVSINSLHHIITRVSMFLSGLAAEYIKWPTPAERITTSEHYLALKKFPNIIGHIDGSHIQIDRPTINPDEYINRKGFPSMILQGICNENAKFIDVFIGFPGSVHDARVFRNCTIYNNLSDLCEGGYYILGDSAYPCLETLISPYRDNGHLTEGQKKFNKVHSSCRIKIEHTFGILKQRFRQLYHLKLRGHTRIAHFIRACCVLHNIADEDEMNAFVGEAAVADEQPAQINNANGAAVNGNAIRDGVQELLQQ